MKLTLQDWTVPTTNQMKTEMNIFPSNFHKYTEKELKVEFARLDKLLKDGDATPDEAEAFAKLRCTLSAFETVKNGGPWILEDKFYK